MYDDDDLPRPLGLVPVAGRGSLPFALLEGESLVACASWALGEAEVEILDFDTLWEHVAASERPLVLHDPLCPTTPPTFIARLVEVARADDAVVLGVRPVTDTLKEVEDGRVGGTRDRDEHRQVVSPLVLPARLLRDLDPLTESADLVELARRLQASGERVVQVEAPAEARRIGSVEDLALLSR